MYTIYVVTLRTMIQEVAHRKMDFWGANVRFMKPGGRSLYYKVKVLGVSVFLTELLKISSRL